jgi:tRNA 5-methylaminomethyl-2-thiouridine biosynthesis bifunctional protein
MTDTPSPAIFGADGVPRSRRYGDVYFSRDGGLAEARAVFLSGCGLPERWSGRRRFTVGELGFGTGLNIAALLDLWRRTRPADGRLSIFSVEAEPLPGADAARALAMWPELSGAAELLLAHWPGRRAGFNRVDLPQLYATLDVAVMDAEAAIEAWSGKADAWFLDGFSPAANPRMWTPELMRLLADRSAPGARLATYSVAGSVRRSLAGAGFSVERRPGFGAKRERLEARAPGEAERESPDPRVVIIGAGIAGAALARAFRALGLEARVIEKSAPGAGASGNPSALVTPRLDAGLGEAAQLFAQAFSRAVQLYRETPEVIIDRGVLQFEAAPKDAARFSKIAASDLFEPGALVLWDETRSGAAMGEPVPAALRLEDALVVQPAAILERWLAKVETADVDVLEAGDGTWRIRGRAGRDLGEADVVFLATGAAIAELWPAAPIEPVRGQLTAASGVSASAAAWGAYIAPTQDGVVFGATYDHGERDPAPCAADDARNLATLAGRLPHLAAQVSQAAMSGRASLRATTPDRLALAGWIAPGLAVLGGMGARGFALAPLLAEHLAADALGAPSPLPSPLVRIVAPERFALRAHQRAGLAAARAAR